MAISSTERNRRKRERQKRAKEQNGVKFAEEDVNESRRNIEKAPSQPQSTKKPRRKFKKQKSSQLDHVEKQTELLSREGTIWFAVSRGDRETLLKLIDQFGEDCLKNRDPVGATPLHILCLFRFDALAMEIVQLFPERGLDVYTGSEYLGENCLHIAIVNHNMELAKCLVESCGSGLFDQEAVGKFFLPKTVGGNETVYYGGYPLSFAVACDQSNMVEYLVANGANIGHKDTVNGNTAMHISILYELPKMYALLGKLWKEHNYPDKDNKQFKNKYGKYGDQLNRFNQSSMTYASATGKKIMFEYVMNEGRQVQWRYGPITCAVYPLKEFDVLCLKPGGRYGALEYLVKNEHLDLICTKHVVGLIEKKWKCFAEKIFYLRFKRAIASVVAIFCASMLPRLNSGGGTFLENFLTSNIPAQVRLGFECLALILAIFKMEEELLEISFHGAVVHYSAVGAATFENISSTFCILIIYGLCGMRLFFSLDPAIEDAILAGLNIGTWINLLWFFLGFSEEFGIFVLILHEMLTHDLKTFSVISGVFLGGFSIAFHLLDEGSASFGSQIVTMVATILGDFDVSSYQSNRFPRLATGFVLLYISLLSLVLVNMLIAKMGDTYNKIVEEAEKRWTLERARLVIDIERSMSEKKKVIYGGESKRYWIVGVNPDCPTDRYIQVEEYDKLGEWSSLK